MMLRLHRISICGCVALLLVAGLLLGPRLALCRNERPDRGRDRERPRRGHGDEHDEQERERDEPEFREGLALLTDVKKFQPVKADGEHIEREEYGAQFSLIIPPREEMCFFQPAKKGSILQVQFQVESGGDADIDLVVYDSKGNVVLQELRSHGNMEHEDQHNDERHEGSAIKVSEKGDYRICFSNRFSTVTSKRLYLDVGPVLNLRYKTRPDDMSARDTESMMESMDNIQGDLDSSITMQVLLKRKHRKHFELMESNQLRISVRSVITILLMIGSVSLQTYFIRLLFRTPSKA